jgi:hypothetical protein
MMLSVSSCTMSRAVSFTLSPKQDRYCPTFQMNLVSLAILFSPLGSYRRRFPCQ